MGHLTFGLNKLSPQIGLISGMGLRAWHSRVLGGCRVYGVGVLGFRDVGLRLWSMRSHNELGRAKESREICNPYCRDLQRAVSD